VIVATRKNKININVSINNITEFIFLFWLFQVGKKLIIDVSNFNKITGIKIPTIIIDWDQIAYSAGVTNLVRTGKRKKLTKRSAKLAEAKDKVPFII